MQRVGQRRDVDEDGARDDAGEHSKDCCGEGEVESVRVVADVGEEVLHRVGDDGAAGIPVRHHRGERGGEGGAVRGGECRRDGVLTEDDEDTVDEMLPARRGEDVGEAWDGGAEEEAAEDDVGAEAGEHVPPDREPVLHEGGARRGDHVDAGKEDPADEAAQHRGGEVERPQHAREAAQLVAGEHEQAEEARRRDHHIVHL
mmetsp:Transcript_45263/g.142383  ORF Transcript_45263/g.142383 Transcript_45263/m.142383 type:complete len:201 (+) Transcript_45263:1339-1941(+)